TGTATSSPEEDRRSSSPAAGNLGSSMTAAALAERNSQQGPHKCTRINPSTGKPCNSIFSRPYDLTRHEDTIHNRQKQKVRCQYCREEKTFSRADALTRHMRVVHPEIDFHVKEKEDFLRWLSPYDFHHKQNLIFKTKHEGTGDWFLQTAKFERWATDPSSQLLWCHGKPGAGKSVLASHVINHIQQSYVGKQTGLCFAYFSFTDPNFQDLTLLVALLLKQLCQQHGSIPEKLLEAKRQARDPAGVSDIDVFVSVTELYQRSFVVVDGLDECPEEIRSPILDFIVEASSRSKSNVKILVSSRKEHDINDQFKRLSTPAIELETGIITPDIRSFVHHEASRLRAECKLHVRDDNLFEEIVQKLVKKSGGM
ncbi:hypothetical protein KCU77_g2484, partial [Aureobasidium melanogenum]